MENQYNIATGIFRGFNDKEGIMICGYEWGGIDELDESQENSSVNNELGIIFSNKAPHYGDVANSWPYDRRIRNWFELWDHELLREGIGGDFEKCILQTNWCNTQSQNMNGVNYWEKLLAPDQIKNFIDHVKHFRPKLIMFFGTAMANILNDKRALEPFVNIMGSITENLHFPSKIFDGKKFKVGFQSFEKCRVVFLPHPSGSRGLNDDYIKLFSPEISDCIQEVKTFKQIS